MNIVHGRFRVVSTFLYVFIHERFRVFVFYELWQKHSAIRHLFHYGQVAELAAKCTYTVEIGFKAQDLHKFIRYFWWAYIPLGVKNV